MPKYSPKPIDTSSVTLAKELQELTEKLAENAHDQWAMQRISDGWVLGKKRDDDKKTHPSLIAYMDLPDSEKTYDRITAMETLKAIKVLGFKIERD